MLRKNEHFDNLARDYDLTALVNEWTPNAVLREALADPSVESGRFLDIGAGTGLTAEVLLEHDPSYLVCVEPSSGMREIGQKRIAGAEWISATGEEFLTSVAPNSFDLIAAIGVLEFTSRPQILIRASVAALTNGGRLVLAFEVAERVSVGAEPGGHYRKAVSIDEVASSLGAGGMSVYFRRDFVGYRRAGRAVSYTLLGAAKPGMYTGSEE